MSLAYTEGKDGRLQVAYEAMDKISVFKHKGFWLYYCPCCNRTRYFAFFDRCWNEPEFGLLEHLEKFHQDDD